MLTSGQLLADRYRLARRIAVGGMGEVWEAADTRLDRRVAVKVLKPELCGDAEFLHRFRAEARTTASLNHPGIAGVHDYGETAAIPDGPQDTAYLVMELVEGEPLSAILAMHGRLAADTTLDILEQAGHALQAAHERGYVHRDVKPGNILVVPGSNGSITVKITDFGIAKAAESAPVTRSGMVMGTAHYIAPEQALGQPAEPASDVYSLAVVGYECLIGHRPFLSENAVTVAMMHIRDMAPPLPPDVPPGLRALIEATLIKDPRQRYRSGGEFAAAAAAVRAGLPLPTPSGLAALTPVAVPGPGHAQNPHSTGTMPPIPPVAPPPNAPGYPGPGSLPPHAAAHRAPAPRRTALWVVLVLLLVLLVGLGAWAITMLVRDNSSSGPSGSRVGASGSANPSTGATPGHPLGVVPETGVDKGSGQPVDVESILRAGEPADTATAALRQAGLHSKVVTENSDTSPADPADCQVTGWTPGGTVTPGTTVTVTCQETTSG